ncbi:MAG TPA: hypothetical protein VJP78_11395, partial [Thermoleophilia bacterium]|nr:hypothetical protein [Thermoleophilia bacterium]
MKLVVGMVLAGNLLLVSPSLMPAFSEINPDDEAKYIESGWLLLADGPRDLAWGPLVAVIYAPVHMLVGNSLDWFMLEAWAGRIELFVLLWLSMLFLALQFKDYAPPLVMAGILFVTTAFFPILENQSDALFVSLSALGLAKFITYYRHRRLKDVGVASVCVGLGILSRVESVVLIGTLVILATVYRRHSVTRVVASALLPALGILVLFLGASLLTHGNLNLGLGNKSYDSFEMNQPLPYGGDSEAARQETRRLFGTQEENNGSVLRAILRNPLAFG